MRIRFNTDLAPCVYESNGIRIELKACDIEDIKAFGSSINSFKIPERAWVSSMIDGVKVRKFDKSALTEEEIKALNTDDSKFIASKVTSISGIEFENEKGEEIAFDSLDLQRKTNVITMIKQEQEDFLAWTLDYALGSKKKSGNMELIE
jgi:hypothetical protein